MRNYQKFILISRAQCDRYHPCFMRFLYFIGHWGNSSLTITVFLQILVWNDFQLSSLAFTGWKLMPLCCLGKINSIQLYLYITNSQQYHLKALHRQSVWTNLLSGNIHISQFITYRLAEETNKLHWILSWIQSPFLSNDWTWNICEILKLCTYHSCTWATTELNKHSNSFLRFAT